jgi:hypothetical protein
MPTLANDQESADRARATASSLLEAADAVTANGVRVPADEVRVFGPVYSWWRLVCRTSEAVLLLTERGFTLEAAPMVRNILNHAYSTATTSPTSTPSTRTSPRSRTPPSPPRAHTSST